MSVNLRKHIATKLVVEGRLVPLQRLQKGYPLPISTTHARKIYITLQVRYCFKSIANLSIQ